MLYQAERVSSKGYERELKLLIEEILKKNQQRSDALAVGIWYAPIGGVTGLCTGVIVKGHQSKDQEMDGTGPFTSPCVAKFMSEQETKLFLIVRSYV